MTNSEAIKIVEGIRGARLTALALALDALVLQQDRP